MASLVAQRLKRLPAMQETQVQSLGREDPLEKEMAYSCLENPTEEPGRLQSTRVAKSRKESDTTEQLHFTSLHKRQCSIHLVYIILILK